MTADDSPMAAPTSTPSVIKGDVPCVKCKYNLRTCPRDGNCPECGTWIAESLWNATVHEVDYGELRATDERWRRQMSRGLLLAFISWAIGIVGVCYTTQLEFNDQTRHDLFKAAAWLVVPVSVYVVGCWAAWTLSTPRNGGFQSTVIRASTAASLVAIGLIFVNGAFSRFYLEGTFRLIGRTGREWPTLYGLGGYAAFAWPVVTAFTFGRIAQLTWLARHRLLASAVGLIGFLLTLGVAAETLAIMSVRQPMPSCVFSLTQISPVGTCLGLWTAIGEFVRHFDAINLSIRSPLQWIVILLTLLTFGAGVLLGPFFLLVRAWIRESLSLHPLPRPTRNTIASGLTNLPFESSAASSPPSLSPRLPH